MAPRVCVLLRQIGLTLFGQRLLHVASKHRHTCPGRAGCAFSKGHGALGEWREDGRKGVGREEPGFGAAGKNTRTSLAVSDKALKKDLKAVRPGYRYLLGELCTNIFLPFIAIHLLFELQRSKLSSKQAHVDLSK